jgi:hypothetical protein
MGHRERTRALQCVLSRLRLPLDGSVPDSSRRKPYSESLGDSFRSSKEDARPPIPMRRLKSMGPGEA